MPTLDAPATDAELVTFFGEEPEFFAVEAAKARHVAALDADDIADVCHQHPRLIMRAIKTRNQSHLFELFEVSLKTTAARRASCEMFGNDSSIQAAEVLL